MKIVLYGSPSIALHQQLEVALAGQHDINLVEYAASSADIETGFDNARAVITVRFDKSVPTTDTLELVQVPGVGCDEIDQSALPRQSVLCNVSGHGPAVAEYAMLGMLQCRHRFLEAVDSFRVGSWERSSRLGAAPHKELAGSVVGLLGYGLIGRSIAKRLTAMDVTVLACNRTPPDQPEQHPEIKHFYAFDDLGEMAAQVDFLVCAITLNEETQGCVGDDVLNAMKPDSIVINVARGPVVQEEALYRALRDGKIGGAVLDVWYNYPSDSTELHAAPSQFDFAALPNTYVTPHISGWTEGTLTRRIKAIAENISRLELGEPLINIVYSGRS